MVRDKKYMAWVRQQPCLVRSEGCSGPVEAHHTAHAYYSAKGDDSSCVPLCHKHHMMVQHYKWMFKERFGFIPDVTYSERFYESYLAGKRRAVPQHTYDERKRQQTEGASS